MIRFPPWFVRSVAAFDYDHALPWLARRSRPVRTAGAMVRGLVNWALDLDWRTLSLGHGYVRAATYRAMRSLGRLDGRAGALRAHVLTLRRFVCASREELDSLRLEALAAQLPPDLPDGAQALLERSRQGIGTVLLTAHFDSLYVGLAALARAGLTVNLMSTRITENPSVPAPVTRHFERKARALDRLLAPGRVAPFEDNLAFFVKALRRGEVVVIACDGPATSAARVAPVRFLGAWRSMASGPAFLAKAGRAPVALYACTGTWDGRFHTRVTPPRPLEAAGLQKAYEALEADLRAAPWRWWAADLMATYREDEPISDREDVHA